MCMHIHICVCTCACACAFMCGSAESQVKLPSGSHLAARAATHLWHPPLQYPTAAHSPPPLCSGWPSGPGKSALALAAWLPKGGCGDTLLCPKPPILVSHRPLTTTDPRCTRRCPSARVSDSTSWCGCARHAGGARMAAPCATVPMACSLCSAREEPYVNRHALRWGGSR